MQYYARLMVSTYTSLLYLTIAEGRQVEKFSVGCTKSCTVLNVWSEESNILTRLLHLIAKIFFTKVFFKASLKSITVWPIMQIN